MANPGKQEFDSDRFNQSNGDDSEESYSVSSGNETAAAESGPVTRERSEIRLTERLTDILVEQGEGDLLLQRSDREDRVLLWLQALDMQVMGACRADERLKQLLKQNASNGLAEDRLLAHLSQHFEPVEVGTLARCFCTPLVSLRVGKINKRGTLLYPTASRLSNQLLEILSGIRYAPPEDTPVSVKSILQCLLSIPKSPNGITEVRLMDSIKQFTLACALLSSSKSSTHELLSWIPTNLSNFADLAFVELSKAYVASDCFGEKNDRRVSEIVGLECGAVKEEERLVVEFLPEVLPLLKERIKESSIDKTADGDEVSAASARVPVGYAMVAAYQFRWFVTQVGDPYLGKLSTLLIPCGLTALDHWSPDVKGQGMISFIHLAKKAKQGDFGCYEDVILDACCQNIASSDEIWPHVVEMSVLLVTCIQRNNPRSSWYERILNEMFAHLERQPRNKDRCVPWLTFIEPLFHGVGLVLLAHFRRLFPLLFQWMHADDDETVLLVLQRVHTVIRLTWMRNSPYFDRLVDKLVEIYKEAALKRAREQIRTHILDILLLLRQCKGVQFEAAWEKHCNDPNFVNCHWEETQANNAGNHVGTFHGIYWTSIADL